MVKQNTDLTLTVKALLRQNTELTETVRSLVERIEAMTAEMHTTARARGELTAGVTGVVTASDVSRRHPCPSSSPSAIPTPGAYRPAPAARMARDVRWPGVMARALGPNFQVIEEGLCGRTTMFDDPEEDGRNGLAYFAPCLRSHAPLDLVIISLGCNDVKAGFAATPGNLRRRRRAADRLRARFRQRPRRRRAGRSSWSRRRRWKSSPNTPRCSRAGRKRRGACRPPIGRSPNGAASASSTRGSSSAARRSTASITRRDQHAVLGAAMAEAVRMMLA